MSLTRVWTPSGNYSSGSTKRLIVLHTMEGFTGSNGAYDCAKYFQGNVGASSQVCIDNNRGKIWEGVNRAYGSWTQCNYNSVSVSAEQSGYASWSKDYWLSNRSNELHNAADWIAEEAAKLGIPIRLLSSGEAQGGGKGVTFHSRLGSTGCGHSDPGDGYPINEVIEWAKGGSSSSDTGGIDVSSSVAYYKGKQYFAYINPNGKVCVNGGTVDEGSNAKSGVGLAINPDNGQKVVSYTNTSGHLCTYAQNAGSSEWFWDDKEWSAKLDMSDDIHVGRKLIAIAPFLLICGIVAQVILLAAAIVLYVPLLICPDILNGPYRMITKAMAHLFAQTLFGSRNRSKPAMVTTEAELYS